MQRVREIRLSPPFSGGSSEALVDAAKDAEDLEEAEPLRRYNWATHDWAEVCWQRRQQRRQAHSLNGVVASNNLDNSVARLSMLSAALLQPPASTNMTPKPSALSSADVQPCVAIPWLPEARDPRVIAESAAEQLRLLVGGMPQKPGVKSAGGAETHELRAAATSAVAMDNPEYEDEGTRSPHFSYPVSIASSQVPSACSTPRRQCSRPRMGRCFALPRTTSAQQPQGGDGVPGEIPSAMQQECELHIHCDGTGRPRRGRAFESKAQRDR